MKNNKPLFDNKSWLLTIVFILIIFGSVYIFTQPALFNFFDLSDTGQIGDTIGGVTSPIINLIGAILIYISFKAQIRANEIQFTQFNLDSKNQKQDKNFQVILQLFDSLKVDVKNLYFDSFNGKSALNVFVNEIDKSLLENDFLELMKSPIYSDWKFIIAEYDLISFHVDSSELKTIERNKLKILIQNYYLTQLETQTEMINEKLKKFTKEQNLQKIILDIKTFNKS